MTILTTILARLGVSYNKIIIIIIIIYCHRPYIDKTQNQAIAFENIRANIKRSLS